MSKSDLLVIFFGLLGISVFIKTAAAAEGVILFPL